MRSLVSAVLVTLSLRVNGSHVGSVPRIELTTAVIVAKNPSALQSARFLHSQLQSKAVPVTLLKQGSEWAQEISSTRPVITLTDTPGYDGYHILCSEGAGVSVTVVGGGSNALHRATGRLLRELRITTTGSALCDSGLQIRTRERDARWSVRGHQYTAAHYPSMFRTWSEFDRFTEELKVFGTNQVELAHFESSLNVTALSEFSRHLDNVGGVNVSFWWPCCSTVTVQNAITALSAIPRVDSLFFPGGDGGSLDWDSIGQIATHLRTNHYDATVWVSAQELNATALNDFVETISSATIRSFLSGVVYGPHVRVPLTTFVPRIPYAVRQYPDIAHSLSCQFPVPKWHSAWVFTHGRQSINPSALRMSEIIALRSNGSSPTIGVGAYSEGLNDDLNKAVWSAMAEDGRVTVNEVLSQYSRYFFGSEYESLGVSGLLALERAWFKAPNKTTAHATLQTWKSIAKVSEVEPLSWRLLMYLHRATYDALIAEKYEVEKARLESALLSLHAAPSVGSIAACENAAATLEQNTTSVQIVDLRNQLNQLVNQINKSVGLDVMQSQDTALNMKTVDTPLTDAGFWVLNIGQILAQRNSTTEAERQAEIHSLLSWTDPGIGGYYDDLGSVVDEDHPRLAPGEGASADPSFYETPLQSQSKFNVTGRSSWNRFAQTYFDGKVSLTYTGLDPRANYTFIVVVYPGSAERVGKLRWTTDKGVVIADYHNPPSEITQMRYRIPQIATSNGTMSISCEQMTGEGGSGSTCQICEAWLLMNHENP